MINRRSAVALLGGCLLSVASASAQVPTPHQTSEIVAAARGDEAALRACVDGHRAEARRAWRRVRGVSATLQPDGHLGDIRVDAPGADGAAVEACLRPVIQRWQLRPPAGGAPVRLVYSRAQILRAARSG
ncbi:MAG: hypothetical protein Q8S73_31875 [Deltaproteobacteria bacterium]|nr:hypothetical protein [Myxococcales bacterium]MDP3218747.1 hypothetical protein [Deltaproteobacteria bacterium]